MGVIGNVMNYTDILKVVATALASVTSAGIVILALSAWLGKVWAARILEQDRAKYTEILEQLRVEGQKRVLVHRVQFETEFEAYREVWQTVANIVVTALRLRPILDSIDPTITEEERQKQRLEQFADAVNRFLETSRKYHPFLAPVVDEEINKLFRLVQKERVQYQYGGEDVVGIEKYWTTQKENAEAIQDHAKAVASAIQRRIGLLEVVGG